jgi:hypothetical protein
MSAYRTLNTRARLLTGCALVATLATSAAAQTGFKADAVVASGAAVINQGQVVGAGLRDTVEVGSSQVVINRMMGRSAEVRSTSCRSTTSSTSRTA